MKPKTSKDASPKPASSALCGRTKSSISKQGKQKRKSTNASATKKSATLAPEGKAKSLKSEKGKRKRKDHQCDPSKKQKDGSVDSSKTGIEIEEYALKTTATNKQEQEQFNNKASTFQQRRRKGKSSDSRLGKKWKALNENNISKTEERYKSTLNHTATTNSNRGRTPSARKLCNIKDCFTFGKLPHGFCQEHYETYGGVPPPGVALQNAHAYPLCIVDGCDKLGRTDRRGMCIRHCNTYPKDPPSEMFRSKTVFQYPCQKDSPKDKNKKSCTGGAHDINESFAISSASCSALKKDEKQSAVLATSKRANKDGGPPCTQRLCMIQDCLNFGKRPHRLCQEHFDEYANNPPPLLAVQKAYAYPLCIIKDCLVLGRVKNRGMCTKHAKVYPDTPPPDVVRPEPIFQYPDDRKSFEKPHINEGISGESRGARRQRLCAIRDCSELGILPHRMCQRHFDTYAWSPPPELATQKAYAYALCVVFDCAKLGRAEHRGMCIRHSKIYLDKPPSEVVRSESVFRYPGERIVVKKKVEEIKVVRLLHKNIDKSKELSSSTTSIDAKGDDAKSSKSEQMKQYRSNNVADSNSAQNLKVHSKMVPRASGCDASAVMSISSVSSRKRLRKLCIIKDCTTLGRPEHRGLCIRHGKLFRDEPPSAMLRECVESKPVEKQKFISSVVSRKSRRKLCNIKDCTRLSRLECRGMCIRHDKLYPDVAPSEIVRPKAVFRYPGESESVKSERSNPITSTIAYATSVSSVKSSPLISLHNNDDKGVILSLPMLALTAPGSNATTSSSEQQKLEFKSSQSKSIEIRKTRSRIEQKICDSDSSTVISPISTAPKLGHVRYARRLCSIRGCFIFGKKPHGLCLEHYEIYAGTPPPEVALQKAYAYPLCIIRNCALHGRAACHGMCVRHGKLYSENPPTEMIRLETAFQYPGERHAKSSRLSRAAVIADEKSVSSGDLSPSKSIPSEVACLDPTKVMKKRRKRKNESSIMPDRLYKSFCFAKRNREWALSNTYSREGEENVDCKMFSIPVEMQREYAIARKKIITREKTEANRKRIQRGRRRESERTIVNSVASQHESDACQNVANGQIPASLAHQIVRNIKERGVGSIGNVENAVIKEFNPVMLLNRVSDCFGPKDGASNEESVGSSISEKLLIEAVDWEKRGQSGEGESTIYHLSIPQIENFAGWATSHQVGSKLQNISTQFSQEGLEDPRKESKEKEAFQSGFRCIPAAPPPPSQLLFVQKEIYKRIESMIAVSFAKDSPLPVGFDFLDCYTSQVNEMLKKIDISALLSVGMAVEELLTLALMPLAKSHVERCRQLETLWHSRMDQVMKNHNDSPKTLFNGKSVLDMKCKTTPQSNTLDELSKFSLMNPFHALTLPPIDSVMELVENSI